MVKWYRKRDRKLKKRIGRRSRIERSHSLSEYFPCKSSSPDQISSLIQRIVPDVNINDIEAVVTLLSRGHTLPFIARYRAKDFGPVSEHQLRDIEMYYEPSVKLTAARKKAQERIYSVCDSEMADFIIAEIENAFTVHDVSEVISRYAPGGEKSAKQILIEAAVLDEIAVSYARSVLTCWSNECEHMQHCTANREHVETLISREIYGRSECMEISRKVLRRTCSKQLDLKAHQWLALQREGKTDPSYFEIDYTALLELILHIFRVLAPRGAKVRELSSNFIPARDSCIECIVKSIRSSAVDFIVPAIRREWKAELNHRCELEALKYFSIGVRNKLLQPGVGLQGIVFGIDPGLASGCKAVVFDSISERVLNKFKFSAIMETKANSEVFLTFLGQYTPKLLILGDGTGSNQLKKFIAKLAPDSLACLVSESGASRYSVSELSMKEFPDVPIEYRGCISIARRALDPLSEYAKIEPQHLSVGMYQHDMPIKTLSKYLENIVSECVSQVGVDLNTASESVLSLVPGLNKRTASCILEYRKNKPLGFRNRFELYNVSEIDQIAFTNAAGFLLVKNSDLTPLDDTAVHPMDYACANAIVLKHPEFSHLFSDRIPTAPYEVAQPIEAEILRLLTLSDPRENAEPIPIKPARCMVDSDPRHSKGVIDSTLEGTVSSTTSFGAFVKISDADFNNEGLVHISQFPIGVTDAHYYKVGQSIRVKILSITSRQGFPGEKFRISLTARLYLAFVDVI